MNVHIETQINASADKVWEILAGRFAEIDQWSLAVDKSWVLTQADVPDGFNIAPSAPIPGRATVNRLGELHEFFIQYSDPDKEFTFRAAGLPPIISYSHNNSKVISKGEHESVLSFDIRMIFRGPFKLLNPIISRRLKSQLGHVQLELKEYAETDEISEEKKRQLAQ